MSQDQLRIALFGYTERAFEGGRAKARERHLAQGKMLVRDRLRRLLDDVTLLEGGLLVGVRRDMPGDAVVTCIGRVNGREVVVIAKEMTVKAGTWGYTTLLKVMQMQQVAARSKMPRVYMVDSKGARIDDQFDCYLGRMAWGNIFFNQVQISGEVPQLCLMFGSSPVGSACVPALCDVTFMVDKKATAYLGSPRLVKIATGEDVTDEQMGGARMHCATSDLGDLLVAIEEDAIRKAREYLEFITSHFEASPLRVSSQPPEAGALPSVFIPLNQSTADDVRKLIRTLVDEGSFFKIKELFAKELGTGLSRLGGRPMGIGANNSADKGGVLFNYSSDKGTRFVWTCNAFNSPLLFLQDISGFMIGSSVERAGIIRHGAKLLTAVCEANVPRISMMVRNGYGGGYLAMSGAPTQLDAQLALLVRCRRHWGPRRTSMPST